VFLDKRHDAGRVARSYFVLHEFIQLYEHLIAGHVLFAHIFQDSQEPDNNLILNIPGWVEAIADLLKESLDGHVEVNDG
jgi:hypothetical protein